MADSDSNITGEGQPSDIPDDAAFNLPTGPLSPSIVFGIASPTYNPSFTSATSSALISPPQSTVGTECNDNENDQDNDYDADTDDNGSIMPPATKRQQHDGGSGNTTSSSNNNNNNNQIRLPINVFLYGTLADPHVLAYFARLPGPPVLTDASISGFKLMRWGGDGATMMTTTCHGGHPTVIPGSHDTDVVHGKVWVCHTMERFRLLQRYKTSMYSHAPCAIEVHNGPAVGRIVPGRTFCWPASRGLEGLEPVKGAAGGRWDLSEYRRSETYRMILEATIWVDTAETEVRHLERGRKHPPRLPLYSS
ncbi:hypothetical protein MCOR25_008446 [Pyricularia grisea]|uniref:Gamma-glutamylcyclotransferase AIG2-like domain-containing protein n=1 Tax=Pyricularia grisea TaxID=148305 RepID=A0A6P8AQR9_PYRGI|nr:uncharacterized protein PgNI_12127 [Pyricularia grisea]KAI6354862.1 hypothetical protein MCOR25_008446 [Pyricularia grisea]TLD04399.1 hypothetical protein PgNI_12127 [Pyricularia grisea]